MDFKALKNLPLRGIDDSYRRCGGWAVEPPAAQDFLHTPSFMWVFSLALWLQG
jgi:hypothetical protein